MSEPNLADVASKTVDHITGGIKAIADAVQKMAPRAWELAVRQQRVESTVDLVMSALGFVLSAVALVVIFRNYQRWVDRARGLAHAKNRRRYPTITPAEPTGDEDAFIVQLPCGVVAVLSVAILFSSIDSATGAVVRLSNPEYYAAKALLEAIK